MLRSLVGSEMCIRDRLILWAQFHASFALVSALRETGVFWAAVIGALFFKEGSLRKTVGPAVVIVMGISLLAIS